MKKTFKTTIVRDGPMCFIPVPFDPRPVFGKVRAPVKVSLNGYTYRSTIAQMGNGPCLPLRRSNREAAGLKGNEVLSVTLELDMEKREVKPPADLVKALKAASAWESWQALSFSHQREHAEAIEGAKKPETRARRIDAAVSALEGAKNAKRRVTSKVAKDESSASGSAAVDAYMKALKHPFKKEMETVRQLILGASKKLSERVKWNAPSFYFVEDLGAFNAHKKDFLHLILLFPGGAGMNDASGILEGAHKDRREVKFHDMKDVKKKAPALRRIVREWVARREQKTK